MSTLPVPDTAKAVIRYVLAGAPYTLGFHFRKPGFDTSDLDDLSAAIDGYQTNIISAASPTDFTYVQTDVYDLRTLDGPISTANSEATSGEASNDVLPPTICIVITERTAQRGRAGRGRLYWPVISETDMTDGVISSGHVTSILGKYDGVVGVCTALGWTHVLVSRQFNGVQRDPPVTFPITNRVVRSQYPGYQRRRNIRP